ncbi:MAG: hypothetical protein MK135_12680, partial [Polyangiaceae bacterium]|nr:hypothetical protein [Polyangiaceae bacterium]
MADDVHSKLTEEIRQHLPQSDLPTIEIVTAVAGLLATVASADRRLEVIEKQQLLAKLELIQGLRGAPAQAILQFLEAN